MEKQSDLMLVDDRKGDYITLETIPLADADAVSLTDSAAFPVSSEFEYMFSRCIPYDVQNEMGRQSLSVDVKSGKDAATLRHRIAAMRRPRKLHGKEHYENPGDRDFLVWAEFNSHLSTQVGDSGFAVTPKPSWKKIGSYTFRDEEEKATYCSRKSTGEFSIRIPDVIMPIEYLDEETTDSFFLQQKEKTFTAPTLENPVFRHAYEKAAKSVPKPSKEDILAPPLPELPQISSFMEENKIEKAIRLAKEKTMQKRHRYAKTINGKKAFHPPPVTHAKTTNGKKTFHPPPVIYAKPTQPAATKTKSSSSVRKDVFIPPKPKTKSSYEKPTKTKNVLNQRKEPQMTSPTSPAPAVFEPSRVSTISASEDRIGMALRIAKEKARMRQATTAAAKPNSEKPDKSNHKNYAEQQHAIQTISSTNDLIFELFPPPPPKPKTSVPAEVPKYTPYNGITTNGVLKSSYQGPNLSDDEEDDDDDHGDISRRDVDMDGGDISSRNGDKNIADIPSRNGDDDHSDISSRNVYDDDDADILTLDVDDDDDDLRWFS